MPPKAREPRAPVHPEVRVREHPEARVPERRPPEPEAAEPERRRGAAVVASAAMQAVHAHTRSQGPEDGPLQLDVAHGDAA